MGIGASSGKKYVLRAVDTVDMMPISTSAETPAKSVSRSRKPTVIYPVAAEAQDTFEYNEVSVKKPLNRRGSASGMQMSEEDSKKKSPLNRLNSKITDQSSKSDHGGGTHALTPAASMKGVMLQSAASSKNLLPHIQTSQPVPLSHQASSSRMTRSNSMSVSRSSNNVICSVNYPWLLKSANVQGQSLNDFELGRVIGEWMHTTLQSCILCADYFIS